MRQIEFDKDLNAEQYAAVTAADGPLLVLAAAGTGKTRTLVYRVAFLVSKGVAPDRILLLTFTNRAAHEMLERADDLIGHAVSGVWGGTFHHMANRLLRRHAKLIGYTSDYTILDRDDTRTLISGCLKERKIKAKEFPKRDVLLGLVGTAANTATDLAQVVADRFDAFDVDQAEVVAVLRDYEERKRRLGAMDFDDMLVNCLRLMRERPDVLERYQEQFQHVLVDEYQDTNPIQADLVDNLGARHRNVFVVGDDFQSIYSWRGANFRNIMSFPERYADAQMHKLETNYRSVPEVLDVANACIAGNPEQFQKTLRATRESYHRPEVAWLRDGEEQAHYVIEQVRHLRREGYRLSDIAVLYRAHFHAMELQLELPRYQVPFVITSGVRFFEQAHIKDVCSILRILENPSDQLAFERLLGLLPGVGIRTAQTLWDKLGGRFNPQLADRRARLMELLRPQARQVWQAIDPILAAYRDEDLTGDGGEIVHRFVEAFYAEHAAVTFDDHERRLDDIRELTVYVAKFASTEQFLSEVALVTNLDAEHEDFAPTERDAVRLSTVHQAKGLEWSVVIVLWLAEGMFPSGRSMAESPEAEAEERRLFYVAVTRAKDELRLCVPEVRRTRDRGVMYCQPSRFVREVPSHLVREVRGRF